MKSKFIQNNKINILFFLNKLKNIKLLLNYIILSSFNGTIYAIEAE
jgi:hypothetical protein